MRMCYIMFVHDVMCALYNVYKYLWSGLSHLMLTILNLKQKHQRCKKGQGQSEAAIIDQKV